MSSLLWELVLVSRPTYLLTLYPPWAPQRAPIRTPPNHLKRIPSPYTPKNPIEMVRISLGKGIFPVISDCV